MDLVSNLKIFPSLLKPLIMLLHVFRGGVRRRSVVEQSTPEHGGSSMREAEDQRHQRFGRVGNRHNAGTVQRPLQE